MTTKEKGNLIHSQVLHPEECDQYYALQSLCLLRNGTMLEITCILTDLVLGLR
jgi:hypothetical protein